ncbi:MAG: hypothetical protein EZS28_031613 [Streblomastix strix]|uniref:Uncharacterized protein n=1 Tax=Streblomastix strix TaxID=222440 RepID=A0A5J4URX4_9EUKA|nr:MAG: hypothetical protein EZS28_031613 [Streblomastix strix]
MLGDDMIDSYSGEDVEVSPGDRIDEADKSDDEEEFIFLLQMGEDLVLFVQAVGFNNDDCDSKVNIGGESAEEGD